MTGTLIGVGVGPGDPELITVAGVEAIRSADVIAYHAGTAGRSTAKEIASRYFADPIFELLQYPLTTGSTEHPGGYAGAMAEFYVEAAGRLRQHLDADRDVVLLALGDPMLYSSYQHLHRLLEDYPTRVIPGIPSPTAAAGALGLPLAEDDEVLTILAGTLPESELVARLKGTDTAVIMKLGRTLPKVKRALEEAGLASRSYVVVRAGMEGERKMRLSECTSVPYFSVAVVPSQASGVRSARSAASAGQSEADGGVPTSDRGEVVVLGLGPGDPRWTTPETSAELAAATDVVGYSTYINRVPVRPGQRRHASDNRVEAERAAMALDLARRGRTVAVVSSGDPGVFAMGAAVLEVAKEYPDVPVRIVPGMTAAQAVASRVGAPLGHDFAMISLSDRLKPWSQVEKRVRAVLSADMAFAVYNPASKTRRQHIRDLARIVAEYRSPATSVVVARAVGSDDERVTVTTVAGFDPEVVDMRTMVIVGASTTEAYEAEGATRVFTSRRY